MAASRRGSTIEMLEVDRRVFSNELSVPIGSLDPGKRATGEL